MRFTMARAAALAAGLLVTDAAAQDERPLHSEQGLRSRLVIETQSSTQYVLDRSVDPPKVLATAGKYTYHRFLIGGILFGTQVRTLDNHILDDFQSLTAANPWDNIANAGALCAFDIRQEPLSYYHRTGPVGAVFRELRTRDGGKDATAPVAVLGLAAGAEACYALRGQRMTFYEADPAVKRLVADTDKYFTYVSDARKRGAEIDIRLGSRRAKLKEDKDQKYALIIVDLAESYPVPTDVFTKEAVREYLERLTETGLVMMHISNKYVRLEPMIAKIAEELGLTARVWYDNMERFHGKNASSWMVLARNPKALGPQLGAALGDDVADYGDAATLFDVVRGRYPEVNEALKTFPENKTLALAEWLEARPNDPRAREYGRLIRKYTTFGTAGELLRAETGHGFRATWTLPGVTAWTDDRADVFILWMNKDVQRIRKLFGYATPLEP
jgi:hypothetical protein